MDNYFETLNDELEKELTYFLIICSDDDKKILIKKPEDKTMEDFARFICLGMIFEMRGAYLKLFAEFEEIDEFEKILDYLDTLDFKTVEKWTDNFVYKIEDAECQELAKQMWNIKKKRVKRKMKKGKFEFKYLK